MSRVPATGPARYGYGAVFLLLVVAIAGCTDLPGNNDTTQDNQTTDTGEVVQRVSLQDLTIFEGGSTTLILEARNSRQQPLHRFHAQIGNRGPLRFQQEVPSQDMGQPYECRYGEIPAGEQPVTRRCVWTVQADAGTVGPARDSVTYPLTAFVTYTTRLTSRQESLDVTFQRQEDIDPIDQQDATVTAQNADVYTEVSSRSPLGAGQGRIPIDITVRNAGFGSIAEMAGGERAVTVAFDGTLGDAAWNMQASTCDDGGQKRTTVRFQDRATTAQVSCVIVLAEPELAGKTFFLRPTLTYRYQLTRNAPLQVTRVQ